MSKRIGICNFKGGVGKTIIAINLSYTLSKLRDKTLLVDLDPQLNCVTGLGRTKKDIIEDGVININNNLTLSINLYMIENLDVYDYIIFDVPPKDLNIADRVIQLSDRLIIPVIPDFFSLEGLAQIMNFIQEKQKLYKKNIDVNIIINQYDGSELSTSICRDINRYFREKVFFSIIPKDENIKQAINYGEPVLEYNCLSASSIGFIMLSKEIKYGRGKVW